MTPPFDVHVAAARLSPARRRSSPHPAAHVVLLANARRYIGGLVDSRAGRIDDWIGMFADATTAAAGAAKRLWSQVDGLLDVLVERVGSPRSDSVARRISRGLPAQPVVSSETAAARYGVTSASARGALNRLEEHGVLHQLAQDATVRG